MTHDEVQKLFTRSDGTYAFARWGRPIAPVVFGVEDATLSVVKGAFEAVCVLAGHQMAETDPELGANVMVFFFRNWAELPDVPNLDQLVPNLGPLVDRLQSEGANQCRAFRFDDDGAIQAAFIFLRMDKSLQDMSAEALALGQAVQAILLWSDTGFQERSALALIKGRTVLRPEIAQVIEAAYDPVMPAAAQDASHALRLSARLQRPK